MITKQIEKIKERITEDEPHCEMGIWLIGAEESLNFVVSNTAHFEYEVTDEWLYVSWDASQEDDGSMIYSHSVKISQIAYITDEV